MTQTIAWPPATTDTRATSPSVSWLGRLRRSIRSGGDLTLAASSMALVSFSLPGRESPESSGGLDPIAVAKFGIRVAVLLWFSFVWLRWTRRHRPTFESGRHAHLVTQTLVPWFAYLAWAGVSIAWSPLTTVSLGQWLGLAALILYAQAIAIRCSPLAEDSTERATRLLRTLLIVLGLYSSAVLTAFLISPEFSGLDRSVSLDGSDGLVHPTAAGATSSLGIALGVHCLITGFRVPRWFLFASLVIHGGVLLASASRSALLMAIVTVGVSLVLFLRSSTRGWLLFCIGGLALTLMIVDPGFDLLSSGIQGTTGYVKRGQSIEQLQNASGRVEMWTAVWQQVESSPVVGHGYFVTSSNGRLDVWDGPANHDAHNLMLQVLVSTGVIGLAIFVWSGWRYVATLIRQLWQSPTGWTFGQRASSGTIPPKLPAMIAILTLWYAGWSQGCVTFLGPIRPESVVFFTLLGLLASLPDRRAQGSPPATPRKAR
ncbi:MAG: O-antigen ligase family protein [Planctomycetota bacterium]